MLRFRSALPALLSFLAAVATFAICLRNDFVYDDLLLLRMDDRLTDPSQWWRYWTESYNGGIDNLYRPLVSMTYALQWWVHGFRQWPFFLVNILLHAGASAALAELTRRLMTSCAGRTEHPAPEHQPQTCAKPSDEAAAHRNPAAPTWPAALVISSAAGLLFATHPIHSEVVASVVGRAESMCALFMFWAMVLLCRPLTRRRAVAVWGCSVAAMLSKEQGLLLPIILTLQYVTITRRLTPPAQWRPGAVTLTLLICWTWAGYIVFRETVLKFWWDRGLLDWTHQPLIRAEGIDRLAMPVELLGRYIALFVWPRTLSLDYGGSVIGWQTGPRDPYLWLGAAAGLACLVAAALAMRGRRFVALLMLGAIMANYLLVSNVFTLIGTNFGERLFYLPSAFILALISMKLGARVPRQAFVALVAALAAAGAARTIAYVARFDDRLKLYEASVREQPRSVRLRLLLASELVQRRQLEDAARAAGQAIAVEPHYHEAYLMAAVVEMERGNLDAADRLVDQALACPSVKHPGKLAALRSQIARRRLGSAP